MVSQNRFFLRCLFIIVLLWAMLAPTSSCAQHYRKPPTVAPWTPPLRMGTKIVPRIASDQFSVTNNAGVAVYTNITTGRRLTGEVELLILGSSAAGDAVHGSLIIYSEAGRLVQGMQQGKWKTENDATETDYTETYRRGVLHGPFVALDSAGHALYRTAFVNGTGYFKRYHRSGRVAYEVLYRNNRPHGWAYTYAPDGTLTDEALYQRGHLVRTVRHKAAP